MKCKRLILLFCLTLFLLPLRSQTTDDLLERRIKQIEDIEISAESKEELIEFLYSLKTNPLNLNSAKESELQLLGLDDFQIFSLHHYISETGELKSIHELSVINGFTPQLIEEILPFVCVKPMRYQPSLRLDSVFTKGKHELRTQYKQILEKSKGYLRQDGKGYQGMPFSSQLRYNFSYFDRLEFSFVADKDAGEPSLIDYYSAQLTLRNISFVQQLTLGDYRLNFGEGLAIGQGFSLSYLNNDAILKNRNFGIKPHRSSTEYGYNRGLAANLKLWNTDLFLFASIDKIDYSGSILTTGLHRTESEITKKDSNLARMFGSHLNYEYKGLQLGTTFIYYDYQDSIKHNSSQYQQYYFSGKQNSILSVNASYLYKRLRFFAEGAMSQNKAKAFLCGAQINLAYKTLLSFSLRNYDKDYQSFYANSIGVQTKIANEQGFNINFSHRLNSNLSYYLAADFFRFPFQTYISQEGAKGMKIRGEINYNPNEKTLLRLTYKFNNREEDVKQGDTEILHYNILQQIQLYFQTQLTENFYLHSRTGYSHTHTFSSNKDNGYYFLVEGIYKHKNFPLQLNLRYAYFDTKNYDNRFSVYEYNLPMNYSVASLYDKGHRMYLFTKINLTKKIDFSLRYALTLYSEKEEISSGNDLIPHSHKQEVGFQFHIKLP
ncbi:MAG: hypothetical protein II304_04665 [Bacteroidales bacterium]|nr:hypothetical protein [Bacteroidales bacterium]